MFNKKEHEEKLTQFATKFLKDNYDLDLMIPISVNGRLTRAMGRFRYVENMSLQIEISRDLIINNSEEVVFDILSHELVHYAMFELGRPYADGQHEFEAELKRLNVISQSKVKSIEIKHSCQAYDCEDCSQRFLRARRLRNNGKFHRCSCGGRLVDMGKVVI